MPVQAAGHTPETARPSCVDVTGRKMSDSLRPNVLSVSQRAAARTSPAETGGVASPFLSLPYSRFITAEGGRTVLALQAQCDRMRLIFDLQVCGLISLATLA